MALVISWCLREVFSYGVTATNNSEIVLCCCLLPDVVSLAVLPVDFLAMHSSVEVSPSTGGLLYSHVLWQKFYDRSCKLPIFVRYLSL